MGYIQGADRNQIVLLPDTLDDYVSVDNEVRVIDAFIDSLDIASMGFKAEPAKEGRPGYNPRDMLKLYMYGYHRLSACSKCPNKCTLGKRRIISFKEGETRKNEDFYDKAKENRIVRKTNHRFKVITLSEEESSWDEWVVLRFYPNQQHLRKRNTVVEHPYGTVKRWHGAGYLLTRGKLKAAAETGLSFLAYNFRRVINLLGATKILEIIMA